MASLPEIIDSFLSSNLPPPVYSFLFSFLSNSLTLFNSLFSLFSTLLSTKPWEWDAQSLLPPLISIFAAYFALLSLYRTTSWMIRLSVWFVKWGFILAALIAGVGWYAANINGVALPGASGVVSGLGGLLLDVLNPNIDGQGQGSRPKRSPAKSSRERKPRPKPWHSFEQHRGWQEEADGAGEDGDVQKIIGDIVGAAGRAVKQSGWWEAAKNMVEGDGGERGKERPPKTKGKVGGSKRPR